MTRKQLSPSCRDALVIILACERGDHAGALQVLETAEDRGRVVGQVVNVARATLRERVGADQLEPFLVDMLEHGCPT